MCRHNYNLSTLIDSPSNPEQRNAVATLVQTALQRGDQRIPLGLDLVLDIKDLLPLPALQRQRHLLHVDDTQGTKVPPATEGALLK